MKTKRRKFKSLRELFRVESRWIKCCMARDSKGRDTPLESSSATSWCLIGAVHKVYPSFNKASEVLDRLCATIYLRHNHRSIVTFNDSYNTTIEDIRSVVKEAKV